MAQANIPLEFNDDGSVVCSSDLKFNAMVPPSVICITFDGKTCEFSFEGGELVVRSELPLDDSAKAFLELLKPYVDNYIKSVMPHDNLKYLEWCANEARK